MWLKKFIKQRVQTRQTIEDLEEEQAEEEEAEEEEEMEEEAEAVASTGFEPDNHPEPEGTVECQWCERDVDYEVELEEDKEEYTTRCHGCKLRVWISGDGWEKYAEIHDLERGCKAPVEIRNEGGETNEDPFSALEIDESAYESIREDVEERRSRPSPTPIGSSSDSESESDSSPTPIGRVRGASPSDFQATMELEDSRIREALGLQDSDD